MRQITATSNLYDMVLGKNKKRRQKGGGKFTATTMLDLINNRKDFLVKVFATLIIQLIISYATMIYYPVEKKVEQGQEKGEEQKNKNKIKKLLSPRDYNVYIFSLVFQFILICVIAFFPMPMYLKFILFTLFSIAIGVTFAFIKTFASSLQAINTAIFGAMSIFTMMFLLGLYLLATGVKLGFGFGLFLWFSLLILILVSIVLMFLKTYSTASKLLAAISLVIFSLYVIYDTNTILQKDYFGDFITAAIDYYLDIINIVLDLIRLER
jgi:FtsH-binding integral membrane protein